VVPLTAADVDRVKAYIAKHAAELPCPPMPVPPPRSSPPPCDAFGVFGTIFRELEWKTPVFYSRAVPKTPNASHILVLYGVLHGLLHERLRCFPPGGADLHREDDAGARTEPAATLQQQQPAAAAAARARPLSRRLQVTKLKKLQQYIESFQYNYTSVSSYFSLRKQRPLHQILGTARDIMREALPIRCLEAVLLGLGRVVISEVAAPIIIVNLV
jgi:hypothetical protein